MIKIENVEISGWGAALRGMRNPLNSWSRADSSWYVAEGNERVHIGDNDLKLATTLANAGSDDGKFLRMIHVSLDITAPVYWWAEMDTYKVATVRNSCSFMHKGVSKQFAKSDFSFEPGTIDELVLGSVIEELNELRRLYLDSKEPRYFYALRQLLPQGYRVKATWDANYAVLRNIYHARKTHRLPEWREFCKWIETLPYAKELIVGKEKKDGSDMS